MQPRPFQNPAKIMAALVAAGAETLWVRDPALSAALDVSPPSLEEPPRAKPASALLQQRGFAYRGARKIYRKLQKINALRPLLHGLREKLLQRP